MIDLMVPVAFGLYGGGEEVRLNVLKEFLFEYKFLDFFVDWFEFSLNDFHLSMKIVI